MLIFPFNMLVSARGNFHLITKATVFWHILSVTNMICMDELNNTRIYASQQVHVETKHWGIRMVFKQDLEELEGDK